MLFFILICRLLWWKKMLFVKEIYGRFLEFLLLWLLLLWLFFCCEPEEKERRRSAFFWIFVYFVLWYLILLSFVLLICKCKLGSRDIPKSLNQPKMTITIKIAQNINYHKSHIIKHQHQTNFYQSNPFTTTFQSCKNSFSTPSTTPSLFSPSQFLPHSFNNLFIIYFFLSRLNNIWEGVD